MSFEHYIVFNSETGTAVSVGQGPVGSALLQEKSLPEGLALMRVPVQAVQTLGHIDMDAIKGSFAASIDLDADKIRGMFITNTPGQIATYLEKEAEARGVIAGDSASAIFLHAEAAALGIDMLALAEEVVAQADAWRIIGARIEAARRKAKVDLAAAAHLAAIRQAITINWANVVAPQPDPA